MKLGVITYDIPHLKTQDLIFKLLIKKYKIKIIITKFKKFKKRLVFLNTDLINFLVLILMN